MRKLKTKTSGFTVAEALITLLIIGIAAVLILPVFYNTVHEKLVERQHTVFMSKFKEGLHRMRVNEELTKEYASTEEFVENMKKYFQLSKVCPNDDLAGCFGSIHETKGQNPAKYPIATTKTSANLGANFTSNLVGLRFTDGSSALIAYQPYCVVSDTYNSQADVTECLVAVYDVNGEKSGANTIKDDIATVNLFADSEQKDVIIGELFLPEGLSIEQCKALYLDKAPIPDVCTNEPDYWAGAVKQCYEKSPKGSYRLPTPEELAKLASTLYGTSISTTANGTNLKIAEDYRYIWAEYFNSNKRVIWSNHFSIRNDHSYDRASYRSFEYTKTTYESGGWWNGASSTTTRNYAMCVPNK